MDPSEYAYNDSFKGGNMILNRFSIDEDAAFELSAVNYLEKFRQWWGNAGAGYFDTEKGKEYSF